MTEDMVERDLAPVVAQLRHAYALLVNGHVGDHKRFADGLIAPQIRRLERLSRGVLSSPSKGAEG